MERQTKGPKSQNSHDSQAQAFDEADRTEEIQISISEEEAQSSLSRREFSPLR